MIRLLTHTRMIIKGKERYKGIKDIKDIKDIRGNTPLSHTPSKPLNLKT